MASILLALAACQPEPSDRRALTQLPREDTPSPTERSTTEPTERWRGADPGPLAPEAERTAKGARNVLRAWAREIEQGQPDRAWELMSRADRGDWSRTRWTDMFARLESPSVTVAKGRMEGAAGSSYYTSPVAVSGTGPGVGPVRYEGEVVLRRANDVPGATPAQLHWHIHSVTLGAAD